MSFRPMPGNPMGPTFYVSDCTNVYATKDDGFGSEEDACENCSVTQHDDCSMFTDMLDVPQVDSCSTFGIHPSCVKKDPKSLPWDDPNSPNYNDGLPPRRHKKQPVPPPQPSPPPNMTSRNALGSSSDSPSSDPHKNSLKDMISNHKFLIGGITALVLILAGAGIYIAMKKKGSVKASFGRRRRFH